MKLNHIDFAGVPDELIKIGDTSPPEKAPSTEPVPTNATLSSGSAFTAALLPSGAALNKTVAAVDDDEE